jgi:hypothetical protein
VIAEDLDGDEDIDLLFWDGAPSLWLFENDGSGNFTAVETPPPPTLRDGHQLRGAAVGDLDEDSLPEILWAGDGTALVSANIGELAFEDWVFVVEERSETVSGFVGAAFADLDGDGDLDVVLPALDPITPGVPPATEPEDWVGSPDLVLENRGGVLVPGQRLQAEDVPSLSMVIVPVCLVPLISPQQIPSPLPI